MSKIILIGLTLLLTGCDYECHMVTEVLACNAEECRVKIESGRKATIRNIVVVGDIVRFNMRRMRGNLHEPTCPQESNQNEK